MDGRNIGHIDIRSDHSFVDLPVGMPADILQDLQSVQIRGNPLRISRASKPPRAESTAGDGAKRPFRPAARKPHRKTPRF